MITSADSSKRFHSLDALRAVAMLTGISVHATHSFFIDQWCGVKDSSPSILLICFYIFFHMFRLHTFFVVAGFFSHMLYHRDGPVRMLLSRTKRIFLPFLVGMVTLIPLMHAVQVFGRTRAENPNAPIPWQKIYDYFATGEILNNYNTHYLWFLYYLMMFYLLVVVLRPAVLWIGSRWDVKALADRWITYLCKTGWAPLWLSIPSLGAMSLMTYPFLDEPGFSLIPMIGPICFYGLFFGFGWMLHRQPERLYELKNCWRRHLTGGLITFIPIMIAGGIAMYYFNTQQAEEAAKTESAAIESTASGDMTASATGDISVPAADITAATNTIAFSTPSIQAASGVIVSATEKKAAPQGPPDMGDLTLGMFAVFTVIRFIESYLMWSLTLAMIGLFVRFFENLSPLFRYIADSSYWLYLAHAPVLMYVQIEIAYWPLHWSVKFLLIHLMVLPVLWLTYHFLVRSTLIGKVLNGRKYPMQWPWRIPAG